MIDKTDFKHRKKAPKRLVLTSKQIHFEIQLRIANFKIICSDPAASREAANSFIDPGGPPGAYPMRYAL